MGVNIEKQIAFVSDAVELLNKSHKNEITLTDRNVRMLQSLHNSLVLLKVNRDKISEGNDYNFPELYNIATDKLT